MTMKPLPEFSRHGIVTQDYRGIVDELIEMEAAGYESNTNRSV